MSKSTVLIIGSTSLLAQQFIDSYKNQFKFIHVDGTLMMIFIYPFLILNFFTLISLRIFYMPSSLQG